MANSPEWPKIRHLITISVDIQRMKRNRSSFVAAAILDNPPWKELVVNLGLLGWLLTLSTRPGLSFDFFRAKSFFWQTISRSNILKNRAKNKLSFLTSLLHSIAIKPHQSITRSLCTGIANLRSRSFQCEPAQLWARICELNPKTHFSSTFINLMASHRTDKVSVSFLTTKR